MFSLLTSTFALVTLFCATIPCVSGANMYKGFKGNNIPGQIITRTRGGSGITCLRSKFKCAGNAACVNEECQCPDGTHGHPNVACVKNDTHITMVLADPKLIRYDTSSAHICLPCRMLLTEIESKHNMGRLGGKCSIKVNGLSHQVDEGYYLLGIDLQVSITDHSKPKAVAESSIRIFGYGSSGVFEYKEQGKTGTFRNNKPWHAPSSMSHMSTVVRTRYDHVNNLAIVDVGACGVTAIFRAQVKYTHQTPGLIVAVKKESAVDFPQTNKPLSGSPYKDGAFSLNTEKHLLKLDKVQMVLYNILTQGTHQDFGSPAVICMVAIKEFNYMCVETTKRAFAVQMCSGFYTDPRILSCLSSGEFGQSPGTYFGMCSLAMCLTDQYLCRELKRELDVLGCDTPVNLLNLDCREIQRTMNTEYPENSILP